MITIGLEVVWCYEGRRQKTIMVKMTISMADGLVIIDTAFNAHMLNF